MLLIKKYLQCSYKKRFPEITVGHTPRETFMARLISLPKFESIYHLIYITMNDIANLQWAEHKSWTLPFYDRDLYKSGNRFAY